MEELSAFFFVIRSREDLVLLIDMSMAVALKALISLSALNEYNSLIEHTHRCQHQWRMPRKEYNSIAETEISNNSDHPKHQNNENAADN